MCWSIEYRWRIYNITIYRYMDYLLVWDFKSGDGCGGDNSVNDASIRMEEDMWLACAFIGGYSWSRSGAYKLLSIFMSKVVNLCAFLSHLEKIMYVHIVVDGYLLKKLSSGDLWIFMSFHLFPCVLDIPIYPSAPQTLNAPILINA